MVVESFLFLFDTFVGSRAFLPPNRIVRIELDLWGWKI